MHLKIRRNAAHGHLPAGPTLICGLALSLSLSLSLPPSFSLTHAQLIFLFSPLFLSRRTLKCGLTLSPVCVCVCVFAVCVFVCEYVCCLAIFPVCVCVCMCECEYVCNA